MNSNSISHKRAGIANEKNKALPSSTIFGRIIKRLRRRLDITQTELSVRSGVAQSFISAFESGDTGIAMDSLIKLCTALGVPTYVVVYLASKEINTSEFNLHVQDSTLDLLHKNLDLLASIVIDRAPLNSSESPEDYESLVKEQEEKYLKMKEQLDSMKEIKGQLQALSLK